MAIFLDLHRDAIGGTIATFDRLIFKGHLNALFPRGAFKRYLDRRGILLKDAGAFFEAETARLKAHAKALADDRGRPFVYLNAAHTHATGSSKESLARRIAEDDGVTEGLVCALSTLEPGRSFTVAGNRETNRLEVVRRPRQCLHFYWYLIDPEFGWMHVRLQSWAPYSIQVSVNGREWLARQLDRRGIAIRKVTTKSPGWPMSRRPASFAKASPTPPGRPSSIGWPGWSTPCCRIFRRPGSAHTGG